MSNRRSIFDSPVETAAAALRRALRQALWISLGLAVLTIAGCQGCDSSQPKDPQAKEEEAKKLAEEKKKKIKLEIHPPLPLVGQRLSEEQAADPKPKLVIKPGHWMPTVQRMKANYDDYVLRAASTLVDDNRQPVKLPNTPFTFQITRPVALAKGREKMVAGEVLVPADSPGTRLRTTITNIDSGATEQETYLKMVKMPSYQYHLVVLAAEPDRYAYLKVADAIRCEWEEDFDAKSAPHYRVALADAAESIPVSTNVLSSSTIAVVVWDEVDPTRFNSEQQTALVDWLHWGGRLIVNGPDSLDSLRGSFLEPYLPADGRGPRNVEADDLVRWSAYWGKRESGKTIPPLSPVRPMSGVRLAPRESARELAGGAGLFYECNVGRGTIVVSGIQLAQRELINWPGYDSFLNAALLAQPRRRFQEGPYEGLQIDWQDYPQQRLNAHFSTGLRLLARDANSSANARTVEETDSTSFGYQETSQSWNIDRRGGVAAWSQNSPVAKTSRNLLVEAAGVEMPRASFVLFCVGAYLIVLVPLNWIVFHTLGRIEWAWIAAPVIAVLGTYGVVRMAQLDIGFVRAKTEIAVLELQGEHPRGLLSRFTAFYSSLSTTYDVDFEVDQSVATPFPSREDGSDPSVRDQRYSVSFERHAETQLRGLAISSNSTRMLQSEQIVSLVGALRLGTSSRGNMQVENQTGYDLRDVAILRRHFPKAGKPPVYQATWIGSLRHGSSEVLGLTRYDHDSNQLPFSKERTQAAQGGVKCLNADALIRLACRFPGKEDPRYARSEEYRLVGRVDEVLPGVEVSPSASQVQGVTVVVAHLKYGDPARPQPDVNSRGDVVITKRPLFDDDVE